MVPVQVDGATLAAEQLDVGGRRPRRPACDLEHPAGAGEPQDHGGVGGPDLATAAGDGEQRIGPGGNVG